MQNVDIIFCLLKINKGSYVAKLTSYYDSPCLSMMRQ